MGESAQSLDLASYIANLSADIKEQVFGSSWTAQALFRALTPLAKQYILRLVYIDGGVQQGALLFSLLLQQQICLPDHFWQQDDDRSSLLLQTPCSCGCVQQHKGCMSERCTSCTSCRCCRRTNAGKDRPLRRTAAADDDAACWLNQGAQPVNVLACLAGLCSSTQTSGGAL